MYFEEISFFRTRFIINNDNYRATNNVLIVDQLNEFKMPSIISEV